MTLFLLIFNRSIDIVSLCLLSHTTHFLQLLNVEYFESISKIYKKQLKVKNEMSKMYISKVNYLEFYKNTKEQSITQTTIMFAKIVIVKRFFLFMCKMLKNLNLYFFDL